MNNPLKTNGAMIAALVTLQLTMGSALAQTAPSTPTSAGEPIVLQGRLEALDTTKRIARIGGVVVEYEASTPVYGFGTTPTKPEDLGIGTQIQAVIQMPRKPKQPPTVTEFRTILQ